MAGKGNAENVRLLEHPDFDQAIFPAAQHFQLRLAILEKDYYITEVLRTPLPSSCSGTMTL
jgi:hypothetical protein